MFARNVMVALWLSDFLHADAVLLLALVDYYCLVVVSVATLSLH